MVPTDSKNDRPWLSSNATLVVLDIRKKAELDLLRLDEHRSGGRLNAANGYATCVLVEGEAGDPNARWVADPVLSAFKHSGLDTDKLTAKRWAEFCAEPRDEEATIAALGLCVAKKAIAERITEGEELEAQIKAMRAGTPVAVVPEPVPVDQQSEPSVVKPPQRRSPRSARVARS